MKDNNFWNEYTRDRKITYFPKKFFELYAKGKILDLGCGDGQHAMTASHYGKVWAIDYSDEIIKTAAQRYPDINFYHASAYNLPFEDNFFDFIYSVDVIEHLEEPRKMVSEAKRVLKPNGILIIQTPNYPIKRIYDFYNGFFKKGFGKQFDDDPTHVYKFNYYHLKKLLLNDFKVVSVYPRNIFGIKDDNLFGKLIFNSAFGLFLSQKTIAVCKK